MPQRPVAATMLAMFKNDYLQPYRDYVRTYGADFGATLWASETSQRRRFDVFAESVFLADKRILDAGCSRGDFSAYLLEKDIPIATYTGVDALPELIDAANLRGLRQSEFVQADLLTDPGAYRVGNPQVVCISGTLNTMTDKQVDRVLESAWAATEQTLAFNFLSDLCSPKAPLQDQFARRLSVTRLMKWAASQTWRIVFRQDYFPEGHDATIIMWKI